MKRLLTYLIVAIISAFAGWGLQFLINNSDISNSTSGIIIPRPLDKYSIESLTKANIKPGGIKLQEILKEEEKFTTYLFSFEFDPSLQGKETKKTTGQMNIPSGDSRFPIVVMLRGYVDQKLYETGDGTRRAAGVFAEQGYITIAPDFLGYAGSDSEAGNIFEARFQTYTTVLTLLESLETIEQWNNETIFLWGHSNGGQIALIALEITGKAYPTTLWAPVSKPFPYSILYYTDEAEDRGKLIRRELAKFEELYDVELYSLDNYFDKINAPIQIHQGTADDAVPIDWSNKLADTLLNLDLYYYKYPGANHNLVPSWNTVVERDISFFNKYLK